MRYFDCFQIYLFLFILINVNNTCWPRSVDQLSIWSIHSWYHIICALWNVDLIMEIPTQPECNISSTASKMKFHPVIMEETFIRNLLVNYCFISFFFTKLVVFIAAHKICETHELEFDNFDEINKVRHLYISGSLFS